MPDKAYYLTTSSALHSLPNLETFTEAPVRRYRLGHSGKSAKAMLAWGRKPSAAKADAVAYKLGLPVVRLEDGFLRSVEPGSEAPLSLIWDDLGVYYDASQPCRLDALLREPLSPQQKVRAQALIRSWRKGRVSKYNHARERDYSHLQPCVLVVDQTCGDASVHYGQADAGSFEAMLGAALAQFPDHQILLKTHPDVVAGKKQGYFSELVSAQSERVIWLGDNVHAPALLEHAEAVFCVTSQMGFEALLWGKPVHVFGMPFYAGRGLTNDALAAPGFRKPVSLEALAYAALVAYPRYLDPETGERCQPERVLEWLALQRAQRARFPEKLYSPRVPLWKRHALKRFFAGSELVDEQKQPVPEGATRVVWGLAESSGPVIRVEDGFIRSVGLGADLVQPQSWVLDDVGMYYDATRPSHLEGMLQAGGFDDGLLARARALIGLLASQGVSKYNIGKCTWQRPAGVARVILVPGQVETDASIEFGSPECRSNMKLLQQVRSRCPNAWLVYKPHPDVVAGLRKSGAGEDEVLTWCDEVVVDQDMAHMLSSSDELHTITSLSGFEALIRGLPVTCYGLPFYSGWGLTEDMLSCTRRTRKITLEELVAAVLICYPTYVSQHTGAFTTVEQVITEIQEQRAKSASEAGKLVRFSRTLRRAWRF
ncbi:capsular polysaccharide biosynthesis protein [Marinobacter xiaoshiensis]|uniref:Capsular polysaccharide biosynthesis protein n=1 Tax=Marinobacter xiaoshiensis TaxID=3073652 RepID=A0ABU2HFW1_9GAMM|nr:capsular polysaccharide biosynthesis protein [Marinobacter sp. F60267]MDS1309476.1 capsular polysaccharide biosynthesis protein [Marinobacter sp. F60267]